MKSFNSKSLKRIAVYTSGGDAPGMNAAIRSVVRAGIYSGYEMFGVQEGYRGMLQSDIYPMNPGSVANTIQHGGTILKAGRCPEFHQKEIRSKAVENLRKHNIDALVCIGGDGSYRGASALYDEHKLPIVGIPGTIDNDIAGTDYTIGFDTAVNTALQAIDKIRDTAASHNRLFIVEVMGRNTGYIATEVGLACGAEGVFFPENPFDVEKTVDNIKKGEARGKTSSILICAETDKPGIAYEIANKIKQQSGHEAKVCVLGHIQRGGSPTALDRLIASRFGAKAIEALSQGHCNCMIGIQKMNYEILPLSMALQKKQFPYQDILKLIHILSK